MFSPVFTKAGRAGSKTIGNISLLLTFSLSTGHLGVSISERMGSSHFSTAICRNFLVALLVHSFVEYRTSKQSLCYWPNSAFLRLPGMEQNSAFRLLWMKGQCWMVQDLCYLLLRGRCSSLREWIH